MEEYYYHLGKYQIMGTNFNVFVNQINNHTDFLKKINIGVTWVFPDSNSLIYQLDRENKIRVIVYYSDIKTLDIGKELSLEFLKKITDKNIYTTVVYQYSDDGIYSEHDYKENDILKKLLNVGEILKVTSYTFL